MMTSRDNDQRSDISHAHISHGDPSQVGKKKLSTDPIHIYMHTTSHTHVHTYKDTYTHMYTHTKIYTHVYIHTYISTHTVIYMHT